MIDLYTTSDKDGIKTSVSNYPGREADHSLPCSAKVGMVELYLRSHIRLHGVELN
jgi:hypothetical protein